MLLKTRGRQLYHSSAQLYFNVLTFKSRSFMDSMLQ